MTNRKFGIQKLSEILNHISKQKPISDGLKKIKINELWRELMGENIFVYTEKVRLKKSILYVKIKSPTLKVELQFSENKILKILNENMENEEIKQIIFY